MKKGILAVVLIVVLSYLLLHFTPYWWIYLVICFGVSFALKFRSSSSFWVPFISILIAFALQMLWINQADNELSNMMAELFMLSSPYILILIASLIYALLAGLAGWTAHLLLAAFNKLD